MRRIIAITFSALLLCSCIFEDMEDCQENDFVHQTEETDAEISISVQIRDVNTVNVQTRSILTESVEDKISCITLAIYDKGGVLQDKKHFTSEFTSMTLEVNKANIYNLYALVNMGDMTSSLPIRESDLGTLEYKVGAYSDIESMGLPMCGKLSDVKYSSSSYNVSLERLFAKLSVRILHKGLLNSSETSVYAYNMCNKSVYLRQANTRLFPFSELGSRAISASDVVDESDYHADLNNRSEYAGSLPQSGLGPGPGYFQDTTVVFYVPENVHGELLPGNEDPFNKTPENISSINGKDYSSLCTYLEFNAKRENTGIGYGGGVTYRYYLGSDSTTDFSLQRNCHYNLTLEFTEEGFFMENWKIDKNDDWADTRVLYFVDEPFVIYKGETKNVLVHYHTSTTSTSTSSMSGKSGDWSYIFDEEGMAQAGLSYTFDPSTLVAGSNGYKDYCFTFTASDDASVGSSFPIKIVSWDGAKTDVSTIQIAELGEVTASWDYCPMYVSQQGTLTINGVPADKLPLTYTNSNVSVAGITKMSNNSFMVTATGVGETTLTFTNSDGSQSTSVKLSIQAPVLWLSSSSVSVNPDGTTSSISYQYQDKTGTELQNINTGVYNSILKPVTVGNEYISTSASGSALNVYLSQLFDSSDTQISLGSTYDITIKAPSCSAVESKTLKVYIIDPFSSITSTQHYGLIDDYSMFTLSSVNSSVRSYFASAVSDNSSRSFEAPVPNADFSQVGAALIPAWLNTFSSANEAFSIDIEQDSGYSSGAAFTVSQNSVSSSTTHSVGKHNVCVSVTNKNSQETISKICGTLDIRVHTAIGAYASISYKAGSYSNGTSTTFAQVYGSMMSNNPYSDTNSHIYYMDVDVDYLTPTSGVYVFSQMVSGVSSRRNLFNCLDIVRPSVSDKSHTMGRLLNSVMDNTGGDRMTCCGEPYGYRRGIGTMLYRALLYPGRNSALSTAEQKTMMLGYDATSGINNAGYSATYNVHDMNFSSDMTKNIVSKKSPFYFTPTSCSSYVDEDGNGYHVIHFLDYIVPNSCGWINLL